MKFLFSLLLFGLFGCTSTPSENSKIIHQEKLNSTFVNLIVQTNLGADVDLEFLVYYRGEHDFNDSENVRNQNIHKALIDSLRQFTVYEMRALKWRSMDSITRSIVENEFKKSPIKIERVELGMIQIPKENEDIFLRNDELKRQHFDAIMVVYDKLKLLKQKLEANKNLSERKALEKEISALEKEFKAVKSNKPKLILE
ncbi:MAG: hypothetical protein ACJASQ_000512 [Crocinitomicaceae bacterium]|jgi:hypothetical protein